MDAIESFLSSGSGKQEPQKGGKESFVTQYTPAAQKVSAELNVPVEAVLSHWGLETNWGKSVVPGTNNLGNIKDFSGKGVSAVDNQTKTKDKYKQYESPEAFAADYANLIKTNPRYAQALNAQSPAQFAQGLQKGGYAEDPKFAQKVTQIAQGVQAESADPIELFLSGAPINKAKTGGLQSTQAQREVILGPEVTPKEKRETSLGEKALGVGETIATLGTGAVSGLTGQVAGIAKNIFGGTYGTQEGTKIAEEEAQRIQQAGTYMPRTEAGQRMVKGVGEAFEASKLPPIIPEAAGLASARPGAALYAADRAAEKVAPVIEKARQYVPTAKPTMAGVGAAEVSAQNLRKARAAELPIPMDTDMMKSDITRRPEDIQFAKTMGKDPRYAAIFQENASVKNEKLQQNLQALSEQTGAQQLGIEPAQLGQQLVDVVQAAKKTRKDAITTAYDTARAAGEMEEAVGVKELADFVKNNASASKNAPVISAIGAEIKRLSKDGNMSLNDVEELRKMVSVLQQDSGPNSYYASQALKQIDKITEGKGGDLYKQARSLYANYKKEFDNTPIMREILSTKPGTTERTVALENLVERSLINKSAQEVQKLFGNLSKMEGGPEIINELKGSLANRIAEEVTKGSGTDMYGKPYVSAAAFKKTLAKLDKGGKLDFIFGKQQAEQYRTLHKHAEDILTIPKEVVSTSGSGETIKAVLGGLAEAGAYSLADLGGIPVGTIARYGVKAHKERKQLNKINEFVNYGKQP